jgi:hypothetical protein
LRARDLGHLARQELEVRRPGLDARARAAGLGGARGGLGCAHALEVLRLLLQQLALVLRQLLLARDLLQLLAQRLQPFAGQRLLQALARLDVDHVASLAAHAHVLRIEAGGQPADQVVAAARGRPRAAHQRRVAVERHLADRGRKRGRIGWTEREEQVQHGRASPPACAGRGRAFNAALAQVLGRGRDRGGSGC